MWHPEKVAEVSWMFSNNPDVDQETKSIVQLREQLSDPLASMKGIVACKASLKADEKLEKVVGELQSLMQSIEAQTGKTPVTPESLLLCFFN